MYKSIENRLEQIKQLKFQIEKIQNRCKHENIESKHGSNTGNYDPSADIYWTDYHCLNCDKRWTTYSQ